MTDLAIKDVATDVTYKDLIREAFIDPIRNVTVVDDEYPTLGGLLQYQKDRQGVSEKQLKEHNIDRLLRIISMCHDKHCWSVDVFDGRSPKLGDKNHVPPHLRHSDLLVLDYHLDGDFSNDDGRRARQIIHELEQSNHFNIVLVHTRGSNGDIEQVFNDILKEFSHISEDHLFQVKPVDIETIDDWLDDNDPEECEYSVLKHKFDMKELLKLSQCFNERWATNTRNPNHLLHFADPQINDLSGLLQIDAKEIVKWLLGRQIDDLKRELQGAAKPDLSWSWEGKGLANYICTGRVFISVIHKGGGEPEMELYESLCQSLYKLDASPMHLLMAKMRHEMDERGFEQANRIISNPFAQAGWLHNLLENSDKNPLEHDKVIDSHWEQIGKASKSNLHEFSLKLVAASKNEPEKSNTLFVKRFFRESVSSQEKVFGHLNAFACSMPVTSKHLTTGAVFHIEGDVWVCLSPACDLVPRQRLSYWQERIGENYLAFKAVQLLPVESLSTANGGANTNDFVFLNRNGEVKAYTFFKGKASGNPVWDTFYAENQGWFTDQNTIGLAATRQGVEEDGSLRLGLKHFSEVEVISELRYEYALNLLQKFGANQTRVGLDFTAKKGFA